MKTKPPQPSPRAIVPLSNSLPASIFSPMASRRWLKWMFLSLLLFIPVILPAGPTNAILFVTQIQVPEDFATIGSVFGNQQPTADACGRGGDLYIRYPDGTLKNLTPAAGYGQSGMQTTNAIAVRQPCVYWDGTKAVFSMVIGAPRHQFDIAS